MFLAKIAGDSVVGFATMTIVLPDDEYAIDEAERRDCAERGMGCVDGDYSRC